MTKAFGCGYAARVPDFSRDTDAWMRDVRDPAEKASEGRRSLNAGGATASYRIAQLPSGQWAVCIETSIEFVGGMQIPWRIFPSREECVGYFVEQAKRFFEMQTRVKKQQRTYRDKMISLLQADLFGFREPEPEPRVE